MERKIVSAKCLEDLGIIKRSTALRMAKSGLIPHLRFGEKLRAVGFIPDEVIEALKVHYPPQQLRAKTIMNISHVKSLESK